MIKDQPQIAVLYGPPKYGKTLDAGKTFPKGVIFAPSTASVIPIWREGGFEPNLQAVVELTPVLEFVRKHRDDDKLSAVIIDDIALISAETMRQRNGGGRTGFDGWGRFNAEIQELFLIARFAPWHTVVTSHETGPNEVDSTWGPGGPKMPSKPTGLEIAKNASLVLRTMVLDTSDPAASGTDAIDKNWPIIYSCSKTGASAVFVTGDRNGIALGVNPLNLRELLHAGQIDVPRAWDWQEEVVEKVARAKVAGQVTPEVLKIATQAWRDKYKASEAAVRSTLWDAKCRAWWITHAADKTQSMLENF